MPSILIVDDEEGIRVALERWFTLRGFAVDLAIDGVEAVEKCSQQRYDVITMDLEMPRMNGLEAISVIRRSCPDIPIVVLSGFARDTEEVLGSGASKVLSKPLRLRELEDEVQELLSSRRHAVPD